MHERSDPGNFSRDFSPTPHRHRNHTDIVQNDNRVEPDERAHGNENHAIEPRVVHPEDERLLLRPLPADELNGPLNHAEQEQVGTDLHDAVEEWVAGKRDHERVPFKVTKAEAHGRGDDVKAKEAGEDEPEDGTVPGQKTSISAIQECVGVGCGHAVSVSQLPAA